MKPPNSRVQGGARPCSSLQGSPRKRRQLGGERSRNWLGGLLLVTIGAAGCTSPTSAAPEVAPAKSSFGQSLSLAMSLGSALTVGDTSVTAKFTLTNNGSAALDGCFGPSWGVSVIAGGHDAGHIVRVEHPSCVERFALLPRQTIVWTKKVPLSDLRGGTAKVTGWVKVVDPAKCDPSYGCHEVSVASPMMTVAVGGR